MTLDEIKLQWEKDCEVDDIELDKSSLEVPKLHAKYSDMLSSKILLLKKYNQDYNELLKYKWLWYTGKLDDDQIQKFGWKTCLLYTSPSPRDRTRSRMPSSA